MHRLHGGARSGRVLCRGFNGPEDVTLLERCPHFRGCYIEDSMEFGT